MNGATVPSISPVSLRLIPLFITSFLLAERLSVDGAADLLLEHSQAPSISPYVQIPYHPSEVLREIAKYGHELPADKKAALAALGFDFSSTLVRTDRPQNLDLTVDDGFFRFHYTLTGDDAVSSKDSDENGIPDYVDLIVETFSDIGSIDFDSLGYVRPPGDSWFTQTDNGGSDHYDVYIFELESGYYGYVQAEDYASNQSVSSRGDNEYSDETETRAMTTFMALRNNYDDFPGLEEEIIEVTSAHEFFHAVQYGYDGWEAGWLLEATAVWMEERHYDDVNDCYQFLKEFFKNPELGINHDTDRGYGSYIYFAYLTENQTDDGLIKTVFERSREHDSFSANYSIPAVKRALRDHGRNFQKVTNSFLIANALLESSSSAGIYRYAEADSFPMKEPTYSKEITTLTNNKSVVKGETVEMNAARYYKVTTSDTSWHYLSVELHPPAESDADLNLRAVINSQAILPYDVLSGSSEALDVTGLDSVVFLVSAFGPDSGNVTYDLEVNRIGASTDTSRTFQLILPDSGATIAITADNYMEDLVFGWEAPQNFTGDYYFLLTDSLNMIYSHFYGRCGTRSTSCSIPYHLLEYYLHDEGLERVSGTWDIVADDGTSTITSSNGPFKLTIDGSSVSTAEETPPLPTEFTLYANRPNPFNPTTVIRYDLPEDGPVSVIIYNVLGEGVRTLFSGSQRMGRHSITWDGRDELGKAVESGIYFCQVQSGSQRQIVKMTLLK